MKLKPLLPRLTLALLLPVILLSLAACGNKSEAPASNSLIALPKTGQTGCLSVTGAPILCAGTGQDGELQTGVAAPSPRFVADPANPADCVTDNLTGLMWTRNANLPVGAQSWQAALDYAGGLTLCGFSDWRLPNRNELFSLVNHTASNNAAALTALGFTNVLRANYWSSSSYVGNLVDSAWFVYMYSGHVNADYKYNSYQVWPVRAGQ